MLLSALIQLYKGKTTLDKYTLLSYSFSALIQLYKGKTTLDKYTLLSYSLSPFLFLSSGLNVKSYFSSCRLVIVEEPSPTFIVPVNRTCANMKSENPPTLWITLTTYSFGGKFVSILL